MITVKLLPSSQFASIGIARLFLCENSAGVYNDIASFEKKYGYEFSAVLKKRLFRGECGEHELLTFGSNEGIAQFIFIGMGTLALEKYERLEALRRAIGRSVRFLKERAITASVFDFSVLFHPLLSDEELVEALVIAASMAGYEFENFKTEDRKKVGPSTLYFSASHEDVHYLTKAFEDALCIADALNFARACADLPANILTPTVFAEKIVSMASKLRIEVTVFDKQRAQEENLAGFCFVGSASETEGKFVIASYKADVAHAPTIALIGKGIIFDTGGVSLKPRNYMTGMKYDMSGAAAVMAALKVIATLKLNVNVVAITPLVENMLSGSAGRPDDIITYMNGVSVEIQDTDCEGRLILADALCYAEKFYKPDCIIDLATLTGACSVALGHFFSAVMTRNDTLAEALIEAGKSSGDRAWRLPLHDDFKAAIKSDVADVGNFTRSGYGAGTITAAHFLEHFVSHTPWAHLDIAGTAHEVPEHDYIGTGASGAGVRLLVDFVSKYSKSS